jgi:hypothetical protein
MTNNQIIEKIEQIRFLEKKVNNLIEKSKKTLDNNIQHGIIYTVRSKAVNF